MADKFFTEIGHVAKDVAEAPIFVVKAIAVLGTVIKDQPELKTILTTLVQKGESIVAAGALAVTEKGINLVADANTLSMVEDFFAYFKATVIPEIQTVYKDIQVDIKAPATV